MTRKCDGVKILDLERKDLLTGSEYLVAAEKGENYKIPLELITDAVSNSSKFQAAVTEVYESSVPTASVTLNNDQFSFTFGIPAGKTGDPGKDGKDGKDGRDGRDGINGVPGIDGDTTRLVIAYKSTTTDEAPETPVGGSWDYATNIVTYPDGWSGSDKNLNGYLWMSNATFSSNGTMVVPWSDPVPFSGRDGRDGVDGTNIEFVYKLTITHLAKPNPDHPTGSQEDAVDQGWTDHPTGISQEYQCEWVSYRELNLTTNTWSEWYPCTIWSKWGVNGKDGDGVEYIYQRTVLPAPPHDITDNNPDQDEYIPLSYPGEQPWTDDPRGVTPEFKYEYVSQRKYKGGTHKWDNFCPPSLWAKYGDNGQDGMSLRVMYTKTSSDKVQPREPDRLNINPGSIWSVGMPTATGKEAIWGIQALVTYDNKLFIDENLPPEKRGWLGPYQITGVPGLDGNNFNYQVEVFKQSTSQPQPPTSNDPYNPGEGWILIPDTSTGVWWKCIATVQGETGMVIEWGAVIRVTGQGVIIKGTLNSTDDLPMTGNEVGDGYVIDGNLWVWNGSDWVNTGKVQGNDGNYYEYRFARNDSWENPPHLDKDQRYPAGWSNFAPLKSDGKVLWATFAYISGANNEMIENPSSGEVGWCEPYYMTGMTGDNGGSGIPGVGYEVRYCKGTETTYTGEAWNDTMKYKREPEGWDLDCPELVKGEEYNYIWYIQVRIIDDQIESGKSWSKPNPMGGIIVPDPIGQQPIAYPMGIYNNNTPYINDGVTAPYVYDTGGDAEGNHYFFLKEVMTWIGTQLNNITPGLDSSAWEPLKNYEAIYTDLLIAPNSLVGGAVFNNNLMFSQRGKNASNGDTSDYHLIDTSNPMNPSNSFRPNFLLDFENGEAYFGAGGVHLAADSENSSININSGSNNTTIDKNGISMVMGDTSFTVNNEGIYYKKGSLNAFGVLNTGAGTFANGKLTWNENGDFIIANALGAFADGSGVLADGKITWNSDGNFYLIPYTGFSLKPGLIEMGYTVVSNSASGYIEIGSNVRGTYQPIFRLGGDNKMVTYDNSGNPQYGYTGTINGAKFVNGICVGTA